MQKRTKDYLDLKVWKICNEITYRFLSPHNKLGKILSFYGWDLEDFASEFYIHIQTHNRNSTNRFRERWLSHWWEIISVIDNYITNHATEAERFIYLYNTGVLELNWNEKKNKVMNYPTGPIGKKAFYARRLDLITKLKEGTGCE